MQSQTIRYPILAFFLLAIVYGIWNFNRAEDDYSPTNFQPPSIDSNGSECVEIPTPSQDSTPELHESFPSVSPASGHRLVYVGGLQSTSPRGV